MGISYDSGKLPFSSFPDQKDIHKELNQLYVQKEKEYRKKYNNTKGFNKTEFDYKNNWKVKFGGKTYDDIYSFCELVKDGMEVGIGSLMDGDDPFFVSNKKNDLKTFLKDFSLTLPIGVNEKVVQLN